MSALLVTIDTCVMREVDEGSDTERVLNGVAVLSRLRLQMQDGLALLLLDSEGSIVSEYRRVLRAGSMGQRFFTSCVRNSTVYYVSGVPSASCRWALSKDGFDNDDYPFVGVCESVGGGIYVTSEEKHLTPRRRALLRDVAGTTVVPLPGLMDLLSYFAPE